MSVNGHVWWGASDRDAVGLGFSHIDFPLFFPDVSYAHSWSTSAEESRLVSSVHAGLGWRWNPVLEAGLGVSRTDGVFSQIGWAGAGFWSNGVVTPSFRYVAQSAELRGEVGFAPGRATTALRQAKGEYFSETDPGGIELTRDEIIKIDQYEFSHHPFWTFFLRDGGQLSITTRDPYPDWVFAPWISGFVEKFPSAPGMHLYWVPFRHLDRPGENWCYPVEIEDMERILERFEEEGVLRIKHAPACTERTVQRYDEWWRDLSVGLWWSKYDPAMLK